MDTARADASVNEAIEQGDLRTAVIRSLAEVIVTLEEHVIKVDHLRENVGFLLGGDICANKLNVEQVVIGKSLSYRLPHCLGFELGDGGVLAKVCRVELGRIAFHRGIRRSVSENGLEAQLTAPSREAGSANGRIQICVTLCVAGIGAFHNLHNGPEVSTAGGLNGFSQELDTIASAFCVSGGSGEVSGVDCGDFRARIVDRKAADAGLWAGSGSETAIASLTLHSHEGRRTGFVVPIHFLSRLELGGGLVHVVKLDEDGVSGGAATTRVGIGFLFDDHDALVRCFIEHIVNIRLFEASTGEGFNHSESLLEEKRIHCREELEGLIV